MVDGTNLRPNPKNSRVEDLLLPDQPPGSASIFTYLDGGVSVRCHEHLAIVHRGSASLVWGAEFLAEGLSRRHWCCCLAPRALHAGFLLRLRQMGVEVERHLGDRSLQLPPQASTAGDLLELAKGFFAEAETARAPAVRWLDAGVWAQPTGISARQFFELHARLNYLVKHYPSVALCEFNAEQMEIHHLFSAIAIHRHLFVEATLVRDNPFYIPPEKFLAMNPEERESDLRSLFKEVGFDLAKLLSNLAGYGQIQGTPGDAV